MVRTTENPQPLSSEQLDAVFVIAISPLTFLQMVATDPKKQQELWDSSRLGRNITFGDIYKQSFTG